MFSDLLKIVFPKNCTSCKKALLKQEQFLCMQCYLAVHQFPEIFEKNNSLELLLNNPNVYQANALWQFDKKGISQKVLHELKYQGNQKIGEYCGGLIGKKILAQNLQVDFIMPVPLHKKKFKERGYNQSQVLSKGINECTNIPVKQILKRVKYTQTQTKKSKEERIKNVKKAFEVCPNLNLGKEHVVILDDVITTGVTINECVNTLKEKFPHLKISVFSLAFAKI